MLCLGVFSPIKYRIEDNIRDTRFKQTSRNTNNSKKVYIIERMKHNGGIIVYELELLWSICYYVVFFLSKILIAVKDQMNQIRGRKETHDMLLLLYKTIGYEMNL